MSKLSPTQEARYALDWNVSRSDLPPAAQAEYDRLLEEQALPVAPPLTPSVYEYTPERPASGTNGYAIASFVLGVFGGVLLSVIFGIVALTKISERPQRGKGLAIAGLCMSGAWLAVIVLVIAIASLTGAQRSATGQITKNGHLSVFSLRVGDCFQNPTGSQSASKVTEVTAVPCTISHNAQVMAELPVPASSAYPGRAAFRALARPGCTASIAAVVDRSKLTATMQLIWIYPEPQSWADGQKTISCLIVDSSQDLTSSLLK